MTTKQDHTADTLASLLLVALLVGAALLWFYWSSLDRMTADATTEKGTLWFYASDAAPDDVLEGHVEIHAGMKVAIAGVVVGGAGGEQVTGGRQPSWGERIESKLLAPDDGEDQFDFTVKVPSDARPGHILRLDITVEYVAAERQYVRGGFSNEWHAERFRIDVPVHSRTTSILRRVGKAALALASWAAVVVLLVAASRWYGRRGRGASPAWLLLLVPHAVLSWFWFSTLVEHATRLHGWWIVGLCVITWYLAFGAFSLISARDGVCRYVVVQTLLPPAEGDAYRAAGASVPTADIHELEATWQAAGFTVERKRAELHVEHYQGGDARISIPNSLRFGGGEAFEIRSTDPATVLALVTAAAGLLGELRWHLASGGKLEAVTKAPSPVAHD